MQVLELIKKTFEARGHTVESVNPFPDATYDVTFIGDFGVKTRKVSLLLTVVGNGQIDQCLQDKTK
jgi:hypothetical protein